MAAGRNEQIERLRADARGAAQRQDRERAADCWRQLLKLSPGEPEALNALANWHLSRSEPNEARALLQRAVATDPGQPALLFNLSAAARACGDRHGALVALEQALAADPYFVQAMFQKAVLLEEAGRTREAARVFKNFLDCAPDDVQKAPQFQVAFDRARKAVAADSQALEALLTERLGTAKEPKGSRRFTEAIDALLGKSRVFVAEPTFLSVARLPAIPFFDRELAPWLERLEEATPDISAELANLLRQDGIADDFTPYVANPPGVPLNQWAELNNSPRWGAYHFWHHGQRNEAHAGQCPRTVAILKQMPTIKIAGRAPNAFFSLLKPKTRIPPHTGVSNIRSTVHLPLIVPPGCGFRVGAETRPWEAGKAWVFDDTIEHEAWNDSDQPRFILIFDVWNPFLTKEEKQQFTAALAAFDEHYGKSVSWSDTL